MSSEASSTSRSVQEHREATTLRITVDNLTMCWFTLRKLPTHHHSHDRYSDSSSSTAASETLYTARVVEIKPDRARRVNISLPDLNSHTHLNYTRGRKTEGSYLPLRGDGLKRTERPAFEKLHGRGEKIERYKQRSSTMREWPFYPDTIPIAPGRDSKYPKGIFRHHHQHSHSHYRHEHGHHAHAHAHLHSPHVRPHTVHPHIPHPHISLPHLPHPHISRPHIPRPHIPHPHIPHPHMPHLHNPLHVHVCTHRCQNGRHWHGEVDIGQDPIYHTQKNDQQDRNHRRSATWSHNHHDDKFSIRTKTNQALEETLRAAVRPSDEGRTKKFGKVEVKTSDIPWHWDSVVKPKVVQRRPHWASSSSSSSSSSNSD